MPITVKAQTTRGTVEVVKDARIDTFAARRGSIKVIGTAPVRSRAAVSNYGYRVQIFNGPNRKDAFATQQLFNSQHPDMRTYISYPGPNYKVHAGDFRTRLEAERLMQELKGNYTGLFIIRGKINPPKITTTDD